MGFEAGNSVQPYTLYTGLTDVSVVAVNPTMEEASKLGITLKTEPVYTSVDEGGFKKVRIDIYVKSDATKRIDKLAFFLEGKGKESSTGNKQFINDFGVSCYAESIGDAVTKYEKWFKPQGARPAMAGEPDLVDFIKSLLNIGKDAMAKLENINAIIDGNVAELRSIFTKFAERKIQVLYYVRENEGNWYQSIYTRYFGRGGNKKVTYWEKHMEGVQTKPTYQNSWAFQEFNPLEIAPSANSDKAEPQQSQGGFWAQ